MTIKDCNPYIYELKVMRERKLEIMTVTTCNCHTTIADHVLFLYYCLVNIVIHDHCDYVLSFLIIIVLL